MLVLGTDKSPILDYLPHNFLLIDDGEFSDQLEGKKFDYKTDSFNPLLQMDYRRARDFISILDSVFPEGANTLTKKNSNYVLYKRLLERPRKLSHVLSPSKEPAEQDAFQKLDTILSSPVIRDVLTRPQNFFFRGTRLVRLNRAELGDFDCFVLGNLLIQQYEGTVVIPDYGFYAAPHHKQLIRQKRLIAGVNYLEELSADFQNLFLLDEVIPSHCTADDAETLAIHYSGCPKGTLGFTEYVRASIQR